MTPVLPADPTVESPLDALSVDPAQLAALLHGAAVAQLSDTGWLRVTGDDRVRWLNGMVTNSIAALTPGDGCYNFVLNAQGRIQGDLTAFAEDSALLLETSRVRLPGLIALLDRFIIMDDVELADASAERAGVAVIGPQAAELFQKLGLGVSSPTPSSQPPMSQRSQVWNGTSVTLIHAFSPRVPRFELWTAADALPALHQALLSAGAVACSGASVEALRVIEGTPRYGVDIRDKDLPQETGQTRALHFAKGCYLGQEIVERIRSRGNVHRVFGGFLLAGVMPAPGAVLQAEGKPVGELTSIVALPAGVHLALGYARREALDRGLPLSYPGGTAQATPLPYDSA